VHEKYKNDIILFMNTVKFTILFEVLFYISLFLSLLFVQLQFLINEKDL